MAPTEIQTSSNIQVISRAAGILRILAQSSGGMSLGQIATRVNLPRSTVQRIVAALTAEGYVASDGEAVPSGRLQPPARGCESQDPT